MLYEIQALQAQHTNMLMSMEVVQYNYLVTKGRNIELFPALQSKSSNFLCFNQICPRYDTNPSCCQDCPPAKFKLLYILTPSKNFKKIFYFPYPPRYTCCLKRSTTARYQAQKTPQHTMNGKLPDLYLALI